MLPFKAYYFFIFAAMAFVAPIFTLYYVGLGLSGQKIGILATLPSVMTFVRGPVFGALVDVPSDISCFWVFLIRSGPWGYRGIVDLV
jgi:hypothetical protein